MFSFLKHRPDVPPVGLCRGVKLDNKIIFNKWMTAFHYDANMIVGNNMEKKRQYLQVVWWSLHSTKKAKHLLKFVFRFLMIQFIFHCFHDTWLVGHFSTVPMIVSWGRLTRMYEPLSYRATLLPSNVITRRSDIMVQRPRKSYLYQQTQTQIIAEKLWLLITIDVNNWTYRGTATVDSRGLC